MTYKETIMPQRPISTVESRAISTIANEIRLDWQKPYFGAKPYIEAMRYLNDIEDVYFSDDASSIIVYFLANSATWKGATARRIKKELKNLII